MTAPGEPGLKLPQARRKVRVPDSPLSPALALQICPSLEHASLVLLNSLLDTVPGEWGQREGPEPARRREGSAQQRLWAPQLIFPGSEERRG